MQVVRATGNHVAPSKGKSKEKGMQTMQLIRERKCEACEINPVQGKAKKCPSCQIALRKATGALAVYRHRIRAASGRAKHNQTYGGKPTKWVIDQAIEVLRSSGIIR